MYKNEMEVRKEYLVSRTICYVTIAVLLVALAFMFKENKEMNEAISDLNIRTAQTATQPTHNFTGLVAVDDTIVLDNETMTIKIVQGTDTKGQRYYDVLGQTKDNSFKDELDGDNYVYTDEFYYTTQNTQGGK